MKILVDMPQEECGLKRLAALPGVQAACVADNPGSESGRELPVDLINDRHALFCMVPPKNVAEMRELRFIQIGSSGFSQLFGLDLPARGIRACNAVGVHAVAIAEWSLAMMINLARDLRGMIRNQEAAIWERPARFQHEIRGSTLGIWGYGAIGRETARQAKALGLRVHVLGRGVIGPSPNMYRVEGTGDPDGTLPDRVFQPAQRLEFLAGLDFLLLSLPLTPATEGVVGEEELAALRPSCYILNPARGPLIREAALLSALREGRIAGAALDTHYRYPMPPEHPLWRFPNVIMTPHISGSTLSPHYRARVWDLFVQNVQRIGAGEALLNELTPEQLQGK